MQTQRVNVKKVYVGSSDLGFICWPRKRNFLGSIFIRSGGGEFRAVVNVENAADSGSSMDQCYGLTIHEQGIHGGHIRPSGRPQNAVAYSGSWRM